MTPEREGLLGKLESLLCMFPGEDRLVMVRQIDGQRKQFAAQCLAHEALIAELRGRFGDENVVTK